MSNWHNKRAASVLHQGGVIAYPTESVFGLGCDPRNITAVMSLLHLKKRDVSKGLLIVVDSISQLASYIDLSDTALCDKLEQQTAKPITWLVPCAVNTPLWLTGDFNTLAVRISQHNIVKQLCTHFNGAIVSTSANVTDRNSLKTQWQVRHQFANNIDYYVPGDLGGFENTSEIKNIVTDEIVRHA